MHKINNQKYVLASLAVFIFIFLFEWVFHGMYLKRIYTETSYLWRIPEQRVLWSMVLGQVSLAFIFTFIFLKGYENKGIAEGFRYGLLIGLLFIPANFVMYAVMPLPIDLIVLWSIGGLIETACAGAVLAAVYRSGK